MRNVLRWLLILLTEVFIGLFIFRRGETWLGYFKWVVFGREAN